jgi:apolipoprotein N-acyltransferase
MIALILVIALIGGAILVGLAISGLIAGVWLAFTRFFEALFARLLRLAVCVLVLLVLYWALKRVPIDPSVQPYIDRLNHDTAQIAVPH